MTDRAVHNSGSDGGDTSLSLLDRARQRDRTAWERIVNLYQPLVAHWCIRSGISQADTADVSQEVFAAVSSHLAKFEREKTGSFRSWLRAITRTKIIDHHRRLQGVPVAGGGSDAKERMESIPESEMASALDNDDPAEPGLLYRKALSLIETEFEPTTWQAFLAAVVDGRKAKDVAADLGITRSAVYTAKSRVLKKLRDQFKDLIDE